MARYLACSFSKVILTLLLESGPTFNVYGGVFTYAQGNVYQITPEARADQIARTILSVDYHPRHQEISQSRVEGTGGWILQMESLRKWEKSTDFRILWCHGDPGAGKTVLASVVIDHLSQQGSLVTYAYFDHARQKEQQPSRILASLLRQVFEYGTKNHSPFLSVIDQFYNSFSKTLKTPKLIELQIILESVFQGYREPVFICLDALDEFSENEAHIGELLSCLAPLPANVKIFVTSRRLGYISAVCERYHAIQQSISPQASDIRSFARERVKNDMPQHLRMIDEISDKVTESAMEVQSFLLARLHMDKLAVLRSKGELRDALDNLGGDIDQAYAEKLARIQHFHEYNRSCAVSVLTWVSCTYDILTFEELQCALAVQPGKMEIDDYKWDKETIITLGMGLLKIEEDGDNGEVVRLIRKFSINLNERPVETYLSDYTAHEFLQRVREGGVPLPGSVAYYLQELKNADHLIAKTCLVFLFNDPRFRLSSWRQHWPNMLALEKEYPLVDYIRHAWSNHAEAQEYEVYREAYMFLYDSDQAGFLLLLLNELSEDVQDTNVPYGIHVAALCNLPLTLNGLLYNKKKWKQYLLSHHLDKAKTPFHLAVENGSNLCLEVLLRQDDIDADPLDHDGRTPLSRACEDAFDTSFIEMLLERPEVDPNSRDKVGRTPLSYAAGHAGQEMLEFFCSREDVDWNARDSSGRTPVSYAAECGDLDTLNYFLARKEILVDEEDDNGRTPLSYAAAAGAVDKVQALLATGKVDPDFQDMNGRRPLSYAAHGLETDSDQPGSRLKTVALLLQHASVNINARDKQGRTALFYAAQHSIDPAIMSLLLSVKDIDVDIVDHEGQTTLSLAVSCQKHKAAQLLRCHSSGRSFTIGEGLLSISGLCSRVTMP